MKRLLATLAAIGLPAGLWMYAQWKRGVREFEGLASTNGTCDSASETTFDYDWQPHERWKPRRRKWNGLRKS